DLVRRAGDSGAGGEVPLSGGRRERHLPHYALESFIARRKQEQHVRPAPSASEGSFTTPRSRSGLVKQKGSYFLNNCLQQASTWSAFQRGCFSRTSFASASAPFGVRVDSWCMTDS